MNKVTKYLNERIDGNVFDKPSILSDYSRDRSIIEIKPRFVAIPTSTSDIQALVRSALEFTQRGFSLPIAVRGSGLSKTGADLSEGMVISLEEMNHVLEIDESSRLVRLQSGVTLGQLKTLLAAYNLTIPVDADPRETIADLISGYTLDNLAGKYGGLLEYTKRIEVVLSNGDIMQTEAMSARAVQRMAEHGGFSGEIHNRMAIMLNRHFDLVEDISKSDRNFEGYSMAVRVSDSRKRLDLTPIFFGSDHTLGIVTEVILRAVPILREPNRILVAFNNIEGAMPFIQAIRSMSPSRAIIFDSNVAQIAAEHGKELGIIEPASQGIYVMAEFDDNFVKTKRKILKSIDACQSFSKIVVEDLSNTADFGHLKQIFLHFLNDETVNSRPAILDDVFIPVSRLADFMGELEKTARTYERPMPIMGSVSNDLYSVRPYFDLTELAERKKMLNFMRGYTALVKEYGGSITGGSSEGRVKGAMFTIERRRSDFYSEIKKIFDPNNVLNPEAKLGANLSDIIRHLRSDTDFGLIRK